MNISPQKFSFSSDFMYMLAPMVIIIITSHKEVFFIFTTRSLPVVCSSSFASKYKHHLIKRLLSVFQDWGQLSDFFFSCQHQAWIDALLFVANMVNTNLGMEVLNIFHSCMDTTEPYLSSLLSHASKTLKASTGSWIFEQGSIDTHPFRHSSCLNCHKTNNWN